MNELQVFANPEFGQVRSLSIDGEPWFVGKDVATILGYSNTRDALDRHIDQEDKNTVVIRDGIQGNPNMTIINESGLYSLILSSKLPDAKRFKQWVTSEVLPAIRKTGSYELNAYKPKVSSVGEVIKLVELTRTMMEEQGCSPNKIAEAVKQICNQFNIHLPDFFVKPKETTIQDAMSMIDFIYEHEKPTYQNFLEFQITVKQLGGGTR